MEVTSIDITSWTASFRYPTVISGVQLSLEAPPISTVMGLINAAAGYYLEAGIFRLGYYFQYKTKVMNLETIYTRSVDRRGCPTNQAGSNVVKREILIDAFLRLYISEPDIAAFFKEPVYPLVLGRSGDVATINKIERKNLQPVNPATRITGQVIPFNGHHLPGDIHALPYYFSDTLPRFPIGTAPFTVISHESNCKGQLQAFSDIIHGKEVHIYFHEFENG